jgi:hypothetical protein
MRVELKVDENEVPLNDFVQRLLGNLLDGIIRSLHGVREEWSKVELRVER